MRAYLRSKGFDVKPGNGGKTRTGDYAFEIKDPDGTLVEFVQTLPTGMEAQAAGKFLPADGFRRPSIMWDFWWEIPRNRWRSMKTFWGSRRRGGVGAIRRF